MEPKLGARGGKMGSHFRERCHNPSLQRPVEYRDIQTHVEQGGASLFTVAFSLPLLTPPMPPVGRYRGDSDDVSGVCGNATSTDNQSSPPLRIRRIAPRIAKKPTYSAPPKLHLKVCRRGPNRHSGGVSAGIGVREARTYSVRRPGTHNTAPAFYD